MHVLEGVADDVVLVTLLVLVILLALLKDVLEDKHEKTHVGRSVVCAAAREIEDRRSASGAEKCMVKLAICLLVMKIYFLL
jgi:hypothetical protein